MITFPKRPYVRISLFFTLLTILLLPCATLIGILLRLPLAAMILIGIAAVLFGLACFLFLEYRWNAHLYQFAERERNAP